jgi:hypothetical protein
MTTTCTASTSTVRSAGLSLDDFPPEERDEKSVTVITAVRGVDRFVYEYDFGDSWEHEVTVEAVWRMPIGLKFAMCVDGANACARRRIAAVLLVTTTCCRCSLILRTRSTSTCAAGWAGRSTRPRSISLSRMRGSRPCADVPTCRSTSGVNRLSPSGSRRLAP